MGDAALAGLDGDVRAERIEGLRRKLGELERPFAQESYLFSCVEGGIPTGAITEVSGSMGGGKTELVLRFLAENDDLRVAWIEDRFTVYPAAFPEAGVDLERVLFVEGERDALWSALQTLRSQVFDVVVLAPAAALGEMNLRRLQLAAERSGASVIVIADEPTRKGAWPIDLQLHVCREEAKGRRATLPRVEVL